MWCWGGLEVIVDLNRVSDVSGLNICKNQNFDPTPNGVAVPVYYLCESLRPFFLTSL